jgi:DNA-binding NarL/FixJ family response regulator
MFVYGHRVTPRISALLVDDDPFTRTVLSATMRELDIHVVAAVGSASEAMEVVKSQSVDVAVLDLDLGEGPTGIDLAHGLRRLKSNIAILILSTYAEPRLMGSKQQDLPIGARFLVKQSIEEKVDLGNAIEKAVGNPVAQISERMSLGILADLSDIQIDIMRHIAQGRSNSEIARLVIMEEGSVEKAIARIIKKLGVKADRTQNQRVMLAQVYFQMTKGTHAAGD